MGPRVVAQDILECSTAQKHKLGTRLQLGDRVFRYCRNAGVALVPGYLVGTTSTVLTSKTGAGTISGQQGSTAVVSSCTGATAAVRDQYADGYIIITTGSGVGETYKVKGNEPAGSATAFSLTLYDGLASTWSTNSTHQIIQSLYFGAIAATTGTQAIGAPLVSTSANYYFWAQTWGPAAVYTDVAVGPGAKNQLIVSANTAGAVSHMGALTIGTGVVGTQIVGVPVGGLTLTTSIPQPVYLMLGM